jgi:lipopolysaccharide transport system ATP-binding protein
LNGAILGMGRDEIRRKFDEIVSFAEVERFLDTPVKRYSSGMYVRLAFAVAAHLEPEILIVDEVLAVGDIEFQKKCLGKMEQIGSEGRTLLFVSHNMGAIKTLCEQCILLKDGRLVEYDAVDDVVSTYLNAGQDQSIVEITPNMRNRGNGGVVFNSCTLRDSEGDVSNAFLIGQEFNMELQLDIIYTDSLYFWLIIFDSEGRPVLSSHQGDVGMFKENAGVYQLNCFTQKIGLLPGKYSISAGAFDAGRTFLEWIDNCQSFEILPNFANGKPFDQRWGMVNQEIRWALSNDDS